MLTLENVIDYINFGALIAFSFVNISVFARFAIRQGRRTTASDIVKFIVLPLVGVGLALILWVNLSETALIGGLSWAAIGLIYLAIITKGFQKKVQGFDEAHPVTGFNKTID